MTQTAGLAPGLPTQPTRRQHATRAVLLGGSVAALLSVIPIVNSLNTCFGLWIILGGALGVWQLQKKVGPVSMGEAAAVGALSGLVVGVVMALLTTCLGGAFGGYIAAEGSHREQNEILPILGALVGASCVGAIVIYPLLACLGGVLAGLLLKPNGPVIVGSDGAPMPAPAPTPEALAASAATRSKWTKLLGCGCLVLLGSSAVVCGLGGYLLYLENGVDLSDTAATEEFASVPLVPGQEVTLTIAGGGAHSTRNAIWLVGTDPLPPGLDVGGEYACEESSYGERSMQELYTYRGPDSGHPEWQYLTDYFGYSYSGAPIRCRFRVTTSVPIPGARLVVTRLVRPSDWVD